MKRFAILFLLVTVSAFWAGPAHAAINVLSIDRSVQVYVGVPGATHGALAGDTGFETILAGAGAFYGVPPFSDPYISLSASAEQSMWVEPVSGGNALRVDGTAGVDWAPGSDLSIPHTVESQSHLSLLFQVVDQSVNGSISFIGTSSDSFELIDVSNGTTITTESISPLDLDLGTYQMNADWVGIQGGNPTELYFEFDTTLNVGPVPEPTTLAVWAGLGGLGMIAARRRRKVA